MWSILHFNTTLQPTATEHYTATHCSTLQHTATYSHVLQHTATDCNKLQQASTHLRSLCAVCVHASAHSHTQLCQKLLLSSTHISTQQRYFGATAQLAAARRMTTLDPSNVCLYTQDTYIIYIYICIHIQTTYRCSMCAYIQPFQCMHIYIYIYMYT